MGKLKTKLQRKLRKLLTPVVVEIIKKEIRVWGDPSRLDIAATAHMTNTLFNTVSGTITIGDHSFAGHNVSIITGTHDYTALLAGRAKAYPRNGGDVVIGKGVWLGSNATILGPCTIGDHAVIAAGAVVTSGSEIPAGAIVAGVPARTVKTIAPTVDRQGLTATANENFHDGAHS
jgi:acetyltransferase-like isoleucine patch superfamily enzyme